MKKNKQIQRKITRRKPPYRKLTRSVRRIIFEQLRNNAPIMTACEAAGISDQTYRSWVKLGRNPENEKHYLFRRKVKAILANQERYALNVIRKSAEGGLLTVERKIVKGVRGKETTKIVRRSMPDWRAAEAYLRMIVYPNTLLRTEDPEDRPKRYKHEFEGSVEHGGNISIQQQNVKMMDALRNMPRKDLEHLNSILSRIEGSISPECLSGESDSNGR